MIKKRILILFIGFYSLNGYSQAIDEIPRMVKSDLTEDINTLIEETKQLQSLIIQKEWSWATAKKEFFDVRISYKKVEIFAAYFEDHFVIDYINGAPLPHIDRRSKKLNILEPSGIQVAEESLIEKDSAAFSDHVHFLFENFKQLGVLMTNSRFTHQHCFQAMREELIRLAALSITGFDSPSGENALKEAKVALESVQKVISSYYRSLQAEEITAYEERFISGYVYFNQASFDNFDRFGFIKDCINPLYGQLYFSQKQLKIRSKDEDIGKEQSVNYATTNLFDTDFLNHKYFSRYGVLADAEKRAELGELLFFDPILSSNNKRSCASCHNPELAFTDGAQKSLDFHAESTVKRNSPTLINAVYASRFFHDMRALSLEAQFEDVIANHDEMNSNYSQIIMKLKSIPEYVERFNEIFKMDEPVNQYAIAACLTEYIATLRSYNSPFDRAIKGEEVENQEEIIAGFNVFSGKANCATCHFIPTFSGTVPPLYDESESEVLAVPDVNKESEAVIDPDRGRIENGLLREHAYFYEFSFKTPTIRNVALTAPYMHNGVFRNLEEVVEFYDIGGGHAWGIAPKHTTLAPDSLHLTKEEKASLIVFMESLTDTTGLTHQPSMLPKSSIDSLNKRVIGGEY